MSVGKGALYFRAYPPPQDCRTCVEHICQDPHVQGVGVGGCFVPGIIGQKPATRHLVQFNPSQIFKVYPITNF